MPAAPGRAAVTGPRGEAGRGARSGPAGACGSSLRTKGRRSDRTIRAELGGGAGREE